MPNAPSDPKPQRLRDLSDEAFVRALVGDSASPFAGVQLPKRPEPRTTADGSAE